jgi:phage replication O-like protein O
MKDNFTMIPNELLSAICKIRCSGLHKDIILCVIRYTYGFHRKDGELSLRYIAKYTNHSKARISEGIKELIERKILYVTQNYKNHKPRFLMINSNFKLWRFEKGKPFGIKKLISSEMENSTGSNSGNQEIYLKNKEGKKEECTASFKSILSKNKNPSSFIDWDYVNGLKKDEGD